VDVDETLRGEVLERLRRYGAAEELVEAVQAGGARAEQEAGRLFGERLPLGLRLAAAVSLEGAVEGEPQESRTASGQR
jgi:hypothetical protein